MNEKEQIFSEEQLNFLKKIINIGAGNAAAALEQMLQKKVNLKVTALRFFPIKKMPFVLGDPSLPVICAKMKMEGDLIGSVFFVVPDEQKMKLISLAERAMLNPDEKVIDEDNSVVAEIGNIIAGNYFTAINDFCDLNINYSVPRIAIDMVQSLLDESLAAESGESQKLLLAENKFITDGDYITTFLLMIPSMRHLEEFVDLIEKARKEYEK